MPQATPSSRWHETGQPDPHGTRYDGERAATLMGHLTDDELANAVYLYDHRGGLQSMAFLTAAKDRIRWLSRALERAQAAAPSEPLPESVAHASPIANSKPRKDRPMAIETRHYTDGSSTTGMAPLPDLSPMQQDIKEALIAARKFVEWPATMNAHNETLRLIDRALAHIPDAST